MQEGGGVSALRQIRTDESDLIYRGASSGSKNGIGGSSTGTRSTIRAEASSSDALIASSQNNIEIVVDGENEDDDKDEGDDVEQGQKKVKHRHRPLFRRLLSYLKKCIFWHIDCCW